MIKNLKNYGQNINIGNFIIILKIFRKSLCFGYDFESLKNKASFITPVPGGIGPMTIAFLLKNVLEIFKRKNNFK